MLALIEIEFFQFLSKFCIHSWDIHSSKTNSEVSRFSYVVKKTFLDICICSFVNWKFFLWHLEKSSFIIKTDVVIPSLLPSILGQSTTSTRPVQIYEDVGVSLLRFKYPATRKETLLEMCLHKPNFPKLCCRAKYIFFHIQIFLFSLLSFSYTFPFSFPPFECLSCISCYLMNFHYVLGSSNFFGDSFFIFTESTL